MSLNAQFLCQIYPSLIVVTLVKLLFLNGLRLYVRNKVPLVHPHAKPQYRLPHAGAIQPNNITPLPYVGYHY